MFTSVGEDEIDPFDPRAEPSFHHQHQHHTHTRASTTPFDTFQNDTTTTSSSFTRSQTDDTSNTNNPTQPIPQRARAASQYTFGDDGVSPSIASMAMSPHAHSNARSNSILHSTGPSRLPLATLTDTNRHVFVLISKGGQARVVTMHMTETSLVLQPYIYSGSTAAASADGAAIQSPSSPLHLNSPVTASSLSSSSSPSPNGAAIVKVPPPIPLTHLDRLMRGYKSKKFQALEPAIELEPAAMTIIYRKDVATTTPTTTIQATSNHTTDETKKKYLHLFALDSRSSNMWLTAIEAAIQTNAKTNSVSRLDAARRAVDTLTFDRNAQAQPDLSFHSLITRHYPHLILPAPTSSIPYDHHASPAASSSSSSSSSVFAPPLPSRRKSTFHSEYVSTKGFTVAPPSQPIAAIMNDAADDAVIDSSPESQLTTLNVLPLLQRGCYFLKYGRFGTPHFRFFQLSSDSMTLSPYETRRDLIQGKIPTKSIDLRSIERLQFGHGSTKFKGAPSSTSNVAFSIVLREDLIHGKKENGPALIACCPFDYHVWTRGLTCLIRLLGDADRRTPTSAMAVHSLTSSVDDPSTQPISWPPAQLNIDIPTSAMRSTANDADDIEWTDFTQTKALEASWKKIQAEIIQQQRE